MVRRLIILFFIYSSAIRGQISCNNQFNGYFIKADGGMSLNLLSAAVLDNQNGNFYSVKVTATNKLSPHFNLGLVRYKEEYFAWNIGLMYTEASLRYRAVQIVYPFNAKGKNPPYVYDRQESSGEGYLIRKLIGVNGGVYIRTPVIDFKINIGICRYFTFKQNDYYQETEYKVYGSSTQFHTEQFYDHNGSHTLTVPNDSVVQVTNQNTISNRMEETNHLYGYPVIRPSFYDIPIEFSFEKSVFIKPVIVTLGVRTSMAGIAKYVGVGFYLGIGFGRVK